MKVKNRQSILFKSISYQNLLTRKRIHCITFLCWFVLILTGTTLIGIMTNLFTQSYEYCKQAQKFCTKVFTLKQQKQIFIYIVLQNFYQNNRMFLDSYSQLQIQGQISNNYHCDNYYTYGNLGLSMNAGGYRVSSNNHAHPCGLAMTNIFNDTAYIITSQGGAPILDSLDLTSPYNLKHKFIRLQNFQLSQWTDIQSTKFINYFTIPYTSTKYNLIGKVSLLPDTYQLILKNNYPTNGKINKKVVISETNGFGIKQPLIGFVMFAAGILVLFFHVFLCFRTVK